MSRQVRAKRIGRMMALALLLVFAMTMTAFGAKSFTITETAPKNGATGAAIENMGVKVVFSEEVYSEENEEANAKKCQLTDAKGKEIPTKVVFSENEPKVMLVLADVDSNDKTIKGSTEYRLIIKDGFISADGKELKDPKDEAIVESSVKGLELSFETLNSKTTTIVSMGMMVVMMGAMLFFGMRDSKKKSSNTDKRPTYEPVNPYKEAKRTGKSVEEILEEEEKRKAKFEEKAAKWEEKHRADMEEEENDNYHVSRPRPISEAGSTYKAPRN